MQEDWLNLIGPILWMSIWMSLDGKNPVWIVLPLPQCYRNKLQIHRGPDQDRTITDDALMNDFYSVQTSIHSIAVCKTSEERV